MATPPVSDTEMTALCTADSGAGPVIRDILGRIGDKWSLLVMGMLEAGPQRFTSLRKSVPGISQRMLTLTLRQLERDGLVSRTVYAEVPPRVDYEVTPLGESLLPPVIALAHWAWDNHEQISVNRDAYDAR
jgi:DNA-binding HxlR family transcriptional regulator